MLPLRAFQSLFPNKEKNKAPGKPAGGFFYFYLRPDRYCPGHPTPFGFVSHLSVPPTVTCALEFTVAMLGINPVFVQLMVYTVVTEGATGCVPLATVGLTQLIEYEVPSLADRLHWFTFWQLYWMLDVSGTTMLDGFAAICGVQTGHVPPGPDVHDVPSGGVTVTTVGELHTFV
jgi:hypothetical protein